uniref:F-box domain-containing protein n=1 Tax=Mycena chlorophos TaxID=658473 RepID=A0ABQ0LKM0_MYCCL|nr:predicted protein [Mycena chlorophos]
MAFQSLGPAELRKRIGQLEDAIARQTSSLRQMHHFLIAYRQRLHQTATFPVLSLPAEVLSEIFVYSLPDKTDSEKKPDPTRPRAPLLLLQVCSRWKNVALSTPELWRKFAVNLNVGYDAAEALDALATRSGALSLDVKLSANMQTKLSQLRDFLEILDRHAPRIETLLWKLQPLETFHSELPRLRNLIIDVEFDEVVSFSRAPQV